VVNAQDSHFRFDTSVGHFARDWKAFVFEVYLRVFPARLIDEAAWKPYVFRSPGRSRRSRLSPGLGSVAGAFDHADQALGYDLEQGCGNTTVFSPSATEELNYKTRFT